MSSSRTQERHLVFVYNIPNNLSTDDIQKEFAKFKPIEVHNALPIGCLTTMVLVFHSHAEAVRAKEVCHEKRLGDAEIHTGTYEHLDSIGCGRRQAQAEADIKGKDKSEDSKAPRQTPAPKIRNKHSTRKSPTPAKVPSTVSGETWADVVKTPHINDRSEFPELASGSPEASIPGSRTVSGGSWADIVKTPRVDDIPESPKIADIVKTPRIVNKSKFPRIHPCFLETSVAGPSLTKPPIAVPPSNRDPSLAADVPEVQQTQEAPQPFFPEENDYNETVSGSSGDKSFVTALGTASDTALDTASNIALNDAPEIALSNPPDTASNTSADNTSNTMDYTPETSGQSNMASPAQVPSQPSTGINYEHGSNAPDRYDLSPLSGFTEQHRAKHQADCSFCKKRGECSARYR